MTLTLYGIRSCDTVRKARGWLDARGIAHRYHDFRIDGLDAVRLRRWSDAVGWETLLNRAGTTFRALPDADKAGLDEPRALALMLAQPAMIKRPVFEIGDTFETGNRVIIGFKPSQQAEVLALAGQ